MTFSRLRAKHLVVSLGEMEDRVAKETNPGVSTVPSRSSPIVLGHMQV